jgi:putative PIN family toxin of toxin-antitoxin system
MPTSLTPRNVPRVILDSNIWIDILVFDDPNTRAIFAALESGALIALIDARCLTELTRVLDYPQFVARNIDKETALATVARLTEFVETSRNASNASDISDASAASTDSPRALPACKDRDDQKFLELAHIARADWLVSKDRAVLKLAKRVARDFGFQIMPPAPFAAACQLDTAVAHKSASELA